MEEMLRNVNGKLLRCGYTTGSCAAAAAKAAALGLLCGEIPAQVVVRTPHGLALALDIAEARRTDAYAQCAVRKDAGDDPDITNGALVCARVERRAAGIVIDGGAGVGRVTRPGLDQPVGAAAINSAPRRMIAQALREAARACGYDGGLLALITIPDGAALAARTFNPRLGVTGGLSVLGTSGIVEPMSSRALLDTIRLELAQIRGRPETALLLTPGNYGETYARGTLGLSLRSHVNCANFIGETLDSAFAAGFRAILLVGHIGKLVKLGVGLMDTHSGRGDGRIETMLACALAAGADLPLLRRLAGCATTDAALAELEAAGLLAAAMDALNQRIGFYLSRRAPAGTTLGHLCFTNAPQPRTLLQSANAAQLLQIWREQA